MYPSKNCSGLAENRVGPGELERGAVHGTKMVQTLACVRLRGVDVTNGDSQLKYDERLAAREKGKKKEDEEMEERQKIEKIKREQMGHEGVVNALA